MSARARIRHIVAVGVAAALLPSAAFATVGTGIGASPIALAGVAQPGHSYRLPPVYVANTGDQPATYFLKVQQLAPAQGRNVPAAWVVIARNALVLLPAQSATVALFLKVPAGAPLGAYESDIVAGAVSPGGIGNTSVSAAAATRLSFTVASGGWGWESFDLGRAAPAWLLATFAIAGAVALAGAAWRRLGLRIEVRRR